MRETIKNCVLPQERCYLSAPDNCCHRGVKIQCCQSSSFPKLGQKSIHFTYSLLISKYWQLRVFCFCFQVTKKKKNVPVQVSCQLAPMVYASRSGAASSMCFNFEAIILAKPKHIEKRV